MEKYMTITQLAINSSKVSWYQTTISFSVESVRPSTIYFVRETERPYVLVKCLWQQTIRFWSCIVISNYFECKRVTWGEVQVVQTYSLGHKRVFHESGKPENIGGPLISPTLTWKPIRIKDSGCRTRRRPPPPLSSFSVLSHIMILILSGIMHSKL